MDSIQKVTMKRYQEVMAALLESVAKNRPKRPPFYWECRQLDFTFIQHPLLNTE